MLVTFLFFGKLKLPAALFPVYPIVLGYNFLAVSDNCDVHPEKKRRKKKKVAELWW